jgi:hypothetical protein
VADAFRRFALEHAAGVRAGLEKSGLTRARGPAGPRRPAR